MPRLEPLPELVSQWRRYARSHLAVARTAVAPEVAREVLAFHAQQAAETAIKAVLIASGVRPPRTHEIGDLLDSLPPEVRPPDDARAWPSLSPFAVERRYPPAEAPPLSAADLAAAGVLAWAVQTIEGDAS